MAIANKLRTVVFAVALAAVPAMGQTTANDCYGRYDQAYKQADQAYMNASGAQRDQLLHLVQALGRVLDELAYNAPSLPSSVCTTTIQRVEAQAIVWHQQGLTPSPEEIRAAEQAAAMMRLNEALQVLEGR